MAMICNRQLVSGFFFYIFIIANVAYCSTNKTKIVWKNLKQNEAQNEQTMELINTWTM